MIKVTTPNISHKYLQNMGKHFQRHMQISIYAYVRQVKNCLGIAGRKSLLEQIIHRKNYQDMIKKPHHSEHPVIMNSPAQTAMYIP